MTDELAMPAGSARDAVLHLVEHIDGVDVADLDGGSYSRISLVRPLASYSTGEQMLWRVASSIAGRCYSLSLAGIFATLDADCQRAVLESLRILCRADDSTRGLRVEES